LSPRFSPSPLSLYLFRNGEESGIDFDGALHGGLVDPDAASLEFNLLDVPGFQAGRILRFRRTGSGEYYRLSKSSVEIETIRCRPSPLRRMDAFVHRKDWLRP
jgi:hypothetical protein